MLLNLPPLILKIVLICSAGKFISMFLPLNMLLRSLLAHSGGRSIILLILRYRLDSLYRECDCEVICKETINPYLVSPVSSIAGWGKQGWGEELSLNMDPSRMEVLFLACRFIFRKIII